MYSYVDGHALNTLKLRIFRVIVVVSVRFLIHESNSCHYLTTHCQCGNAGQTYQESRVVRVRQGVAVEGGYHKGTSSVGHIAEGDHVSPSDLAVCMGIIDGSVCVPEHHVRPIYKFGEQSGYMQSQLNNV